MRSLVVVEVGPWLELCVSVVSVIPVGGVGPFSERGLDEALGFSVGSGGVGACSAMGHVHLEAGLAELGRAVAASVVAEQGSYLDVAPGEEGHGLAQEGDGGLGRLIRQ